MNEQEFLKSAIKEISHEFAELLKTSNASSETRHSKTDGKIDKLIDVIAENTLELRETRKEQEHSSKRQERFEQNQKEQGEEIRDIAGQMLLINERQSNNKGKWDRVASISSSLGLAFVLAYLGLKK